MLIQSPVMKHIKAFLAIVPFCIFLNSCMEEGDSVGGGAAGDGFLYEYEKGHFKVKFPVEPKAQSHRVFGDDNIEAKASVNGVTFTARYIPDATGAADDIDKYLKERGEKTVANMKITSAKEIEVSGLRAVRVEEVTTDDLDITAFRVHVPANGRIYTLEVHGATPRIDLAAVNAFIDSFEIQKKE